MPASVAAVYVEYRRNARVAMATCSMADLRVGWGAPSSHPFRARVRSADVAEVEHADGVAVVVDADADPAQRGPRLHQDGPVSGGAQPGLDGSRGGEGGSLDEVLAGPVQVAAAQDAALVAVHEVAAGRELLRPSLREPVEAGVDGAHRPEARGPPVPVGDSEDLVLELV